MNNLLSTRDLALTTAINNNNLNYTTTSGINTLLTNNVNARDLAITNNNANYTTTLLLTTLINNNIVANNLLYSTTVAMNAAIALSSSSCNTYSTAYTSTKLSTEIAILINRML